MKKRDSKIIANVLWAVVLAALVVKLSHVAAIFLALYVAIKYGLKLK